MRIDRCRWIVRALAWSVAALGCAPPGGVAKSGIAHGSAPPAAAVVEHKVPESELTTITLTETAEKRLGIESVPLEAKSLPRRRLAAGEIVAPPGKASVQTAPFAGNISLPEGSTAMVAGNRVRADEVVCILAPLLGVETQTSLSATRAAAKGARDKTSIELDAAHVALERAQQLLKDDAGTQRSVDEATARVRAAEATLRGNEAELEVLARGLAASPGEKPRIEIRAPVSGILRDVRVASGQLLAAGAVLFEVVPVEGYWVRVPVYVGDTAGVDRSAPALVGRMGAPVMGPATPVSGPLSADPLSFGIDLYYEAPHAQPAWQIAERVSVSLPLAVSAEEVVVPRGAIVYDAYGGTWVYESLGSHRYARRRVGIAAGSAELVSLRSALKAGSQIVVQGVAELFGTELGAGK